MNVYADLKKQLKQVCIRQDTLALEARQLDYEALKGKRNTVFVHLSHALDMAFQDMYGATNPEVQFILKEFFRDFNDSFILVDDLLKEHRKDMNCCKSKELR